MAGGQVFYLKRRVGESQYKADDGRGIDGAERVLVDPDALAKKPVPHAITISCQRGAPLVAYGVSAGAPRTRRSS